MNCVYEGSKQREPIVALIFVSSADQPIGKNKLSFEFVSLVAWPTHLEADVLLANSILPSKNT